MSLKEQLLTIIKEKELKIYEELDNKMNANKLYINESNKVMEENKRIIECFLQQKYQIDKIENLEKLTNKANDSLISHEIKISNISKDMNFMKTKYDKIVLDNLLISGVIGPSCQFKNLSSYIKNLNTEFARIKNDNENMKKDTKEFKIKLDGASKNIINLIDGGILRSNQYSDNRINDFHTILENKIKEINEKNMEMRMKNIQFQTKIEEELKDLKKEYEEKMIKQAEDLSKDIKTKMEFLDMNYLSIESNPKIMEIDNIKNNYTQLVKEVKEIKQLFQNMKGETNINYNYNIINGESKFKQKNRKMYENNKNRNIVERKLLATTVNQKRLAENLSFIKKEKNIDRLEIRDSQDMISPVRSRLQKDKDRDRDRDSNIIIYSPKKSSESLKIKDLDNNDDNNSTYKNEINRNKSNTSIPKKYRTKTNLISLRDKLEKKYLIENISDNMSKENIIKNRNSIKSINNNNLIMRDSNFNTDNIIFNNDNSNNINKSYKKELIRAKNRYNSNLTKTINEKSNSFISISNSSKNDNYNEIQNNYTEIKELKKKALLLNKKTSTNNSNISNLNKKNISEHKILMNLINKTERFNQYKNKKLKNLQIDIFDNNNLSKMNMNLNTTQTNYRDEIVNELFSKYNKDNITTNLSLIKEKGNLDLYNYSISPPDKYIGNAKIRISHLYEPPPQDLYFNKNNNNEFDKTSKQYYTKRNLSLRPNLNMQLYYGKYSHEKKKDNLKKTNNLSNVEPRIKLNDKSQKNNVSRKIYPNFGKTIYTDYVNKDKLFTMTSYKAKNN